MVLLFVDLNSEIDHVIIEVDFDTTSGLHDLLIFRENHVLSEVILSAELGKIVTADLIRMEIRASNRDHVIVLALVCSLVGAVYEYRASQFLVLIVLVDSLEVIDDRTCARE